MPRPFGVMFRQVVVRVHCCSEVRPLKHSFLSPLFSSIHHTEDEKAKREVSSWTLEGDINTDPWAGYRYTGKLRPHYPLVSK